METSAYYTSTILDKTYPVTGFRANMHPAGLTEFQLGDSWAGATIVAIDFYTGFPGCPARNYIKTIAPDGRKSGFVVNAC